MMSVTWFSRLGFDTVRFAFVLRTGVAVCLAIAMAWSFGLEHPQWAGMTVWATALPTRGQLLAKSSARLIGTLLGSVVGILLVYLAAGQVGWLVLGLSLWIALCVFAAHLVRSFVTYGCMLAGYSAALVALVDTAHHEQILTLGLDRMLTAFVGVFVAIAISWFFARLANGGDERGELKAITVGVLQLLSARLEAGPKLSTANRDRLIARLAAMDASLEMRGLGTARARQQVRRLRLLLLVLVSILIWSRKAKSSELGEAIGNALGEATAAIEQGQFERLTRALNCAIELCEKESNLNRLRYNLSRLLALASVLDDAPVIAQRDKLDTPLTLHRDWAGARQSGIRALTLMLSVGAVWMLSGSQIGAFMLLGTAVMTSLFSTFDSPVSTMRSVFLGQVLGACAALTCRWLIWPEAQSELMLILSIFPFVMLGVLLFAHRRLVFAGMDYNMVLLLLLQPHLPLTGSFEHTLLMAGAVVSAPLIAMLGYWLIYPVNAERRIDSMRGMMLHELRDMALKPASGISRERWRIRLYHRLLHLVRWSSLLGDRRFPAAEWGVTLLRLEMVTELMQSLIETPSNLPRGVRRAVNHALLRVAQLEQDPAAVLRALKLVNRRLVREPGRQDTETFSLAIQAFEENLSLFTPKRS
ncbi:FUSC family protein [Marinobacterium sp. D7]|uniref:FUSC family protein n=1 Tax=Marinobacterium ramblicola TaxID=2849041 RepID=UPI001C2D8383|nr:FUSC family protein [Marinobacterium ramblicola]MBV1788044.1 FUSC family protein [Marinobacterium ramblicola]